VEPLRLLFPAEVEMDLSQVEQSLTEWDQQVYFQLVSTELTAEQKSRIIEPPMTYPRQDAVIAVHWHPEFIPIELIERRIDLTFPNRRHELIIPTQHNVLMSYKGYAGVEIDCYSSGFNRKVQLLAHFRSDALKRADVLRAMLEHTFRYRSSQLFDFIDSVIDDAYSDRVDRAAARTSASEALVQFVRIHVAKLKALIDRNETITPPEMIKNKLIRNYFNALRGHYDDRIIDHAQVFLREVKMIVKREFRLSYFYRTEEVIEEVRGLGGGIVIPHPEQFWPILLAGYDVDGIEVWNPQSQEYTEFLIHVVNGQNKARKKSERSLLVFMGDDTHFGEKVLNPQHQDEEKAGRELGVQPAWDDLAIRKSLIVANVDRARLIEQYKSRLA